MATTAEIAAIFAQAKVPLGTGATPGETGTQRLTRIANEVNSGKRSLASVTTSVNRLAGGVKTGISPAKPVMLGEEKKDEFDARGAATIKSLLSNYGLDELVPQVDAWVRQGLSWPEIEVQLRDPSTAPGKVVDRLYPEIQLRNKKGLAPMAIDQIQRFRTDARQMMRASGVPEGFYDSNEDFTNMIVGDVSPTELRDRIAEYEDFGAQIAAGAGGELDLFERAYGVKPTAIQLAALVTNPDKALPGLRRQFSAVRLDVASGRAGFGDLNGGEAERLADVGVTEQQAVAGFGQLQQSQQLFGALPGQERGEDAITRQEQLGAAFEGNAQAQQKIQNRAERRKAMFGGGGAFAEGKGGFAGLGKAR